MLAERIKQTIANLSAFDDDTLVHYYKCSLSKQLPSEKPLYHPLLKAIEQERSKRNKLKLLEGDTDVGHNEERT